MTSLRNYFFRGGMIKETNVFLVSLCKTL